MNPLENTADLLKKQVDRSKSILRESKDEIILLLNWSWPILIANILNNVAYLIINMVFVGHVGEQQLAGVALGNTFTFATSAIAIGALNAMDTLISQSFGAKNYTLISLTVQHAMIISFGCCVFVNAIWLATKPILLVLHQDPVVSEYARQYVYGMIPGLYFGTFLTILQKYLQAQGIMKPSIIVGVVLNIFNAILNFFLVHGFGLYEGMGVVGSALSTSIAKFAACVSLLVYIIVFKLYKQPIRTWYGFSRESLRWQPIKEFLTLGIPAGLQMAFEGCGFEILTILAGLFDAVSLAAHSIAMNFTLLTFMMPFSLSIALSVRIGQLLGARQPDAAKRATRISLGMAICTMLVVSIIQLSARKYIGSIYSEDQQVRLLVSKILPISALYQMFDGYQTMCQGVIRGIGRNHIGAIANFVAFYVIGLPFSCVFAFVIMHKVYGLWWGLCIGLATAALSLGFYVARINWHEEMKKALERTGSSEESSVEEGEAGDLIKRRTATGEHKESSDEDDSSSTATNTISDDKVLLGSSVNDLKRSIALEEYHDNESTNADLSINNNNNSINNIVLTSNFDQSTDNDDDEDEDLL
ncbi:hypothetical protein PPL_08075 [Heterostelium album PN500]|uniref:Uncharacterized protein n=1 Tax=Heterostelium pallidum (strain ATCC 26659 / Pp 5 / PN500) TaxID=670386 RepID=D3BIJ6_HETP5|nr:hypothetical protein PPL_08075 [Heterostelium album PN500]EFA78620.1 hypothetical protein PPL_08075 [Heterostelium album PN500]|eukprot:XP_020430744.1 hypothetical protein PPL_08075 [Heterostelium album PN500]